ncbi:unnamed protein product [Soboliphyme baturini]|uniref:Ovule protein n=1 Tax=Soboliphyme baturini TaxID=241478 RepID=A0A183JAW8_9BILA|nr:unnamed protein product [Soboliphyme baturini]
MLMTVYCVDSGRWMQLASRITGKEYNTVCISLWRNFKTLFLPTVIIMLYEFQGRRESCCEIIAVKRERLCPSLIMWYFVMEKSRQTIASSSFVVWL